MPTKGVLTAAKKPAKRGRPPIGHKKSHQLELDVEGALRAVESPEARGLIGAMLASKTRGRNQWRGLLAVPPGSLIEAICGEFRHKTNIPLEIPFFTFFSIVSGYLVHKQVVVQTPIGPILPDIWTVILASSSAGKTFTERSISKGLADVVEAIEFPGTGLVSGAAFVQTLEQRPRGLWIRDEFAQFLKAVNDQNGPMADMKDYLLRLYDNRTITRQTKADLFEAEDPALTILGLTVLETFSAHVTVESMLDGFAQRFGYVIAKPDPARPWEQYPVWEINADGWVNRWRQIDEAVLPEYQTPDDFQAVFGAAFNVLYNEQIPESFYRRILWKAHKYALIYHVMRAPADRVISAEDYGWAARALSIHIDDAVELIGEHNLSGLERILVSAERVRERVMAEKRRPCSPRELVQGVKAITSVQQARMILDMLAEHDALTVE